MYPSSNVSSFDTWLSSNVKGGIVLFTSIFVSGTVAFVLLNIVRVLVVMDLYVSVIDQHGLFEVPVEGMVCRVPISGLFILIGVK